MYIDVIIKFKNIPTVYENNIQNVGSSFIKVTGYFKNTYPNITDIKFPKKKQNKINLYFFNKDINIIVIHESDIDTNKTTNDILYPTDKVAFFIKNVLNKKEIIVTSFIHPIYALFILNIFLLKIQSDTYLVTKY